MQPHSSVSFKLYWLGLAILHLSIAAPPISAQDAAASEKARASWQQVLDARVERIAERSAAEIAEVTKENWPDLQRKWRTELQEMLGLNPWPEHAPLKTKVVGTLELEGVKISRLHYQASPGLYVAANLYEPTRAKPAEGWPAILYVCGHANVRDESRLLGNKTGYHHHGLWFAREGLVCLTIDTVQLGEFHGEHHGTYKLGRWDWINKGYTPAGVEAWNAIRGLDLLESLPTVDKTRIGMTGRSGGGAYSWYTAALDDRVRACVPVAGITDLEDHVTNGCVTGHCDCMYLINHYGWDYPKLAALIAPRALLLANSDHDKIFPLPGVMRTHRQLDALYSRLGASENYGVLITPGPHEDTQELQVGAFRWLIKHLTGQVPVVNRAATKELKPDQLQVFVEETPNDQRVSSLSQWFVPHDDLFGRIDAFKNSASGTQTPELAKELELALLQSLYRLAPRWAAYDSAPNIEVADEGEIDGRKWTLFKTLGDWSSKLLVLEASKDAAKDALPVVHFEPSLNSQPHPELIIRALSKGDSEKGRQLVLMPRGSDAIDSVTTVRDKMHLVRRFYLLGDSPDYMAIREGLSMLAWQLSDKHLGADKVILRASGRAAGQALLLSLMASPQPVSNAPSWIASSRFPKIHSLELTDFNDDPMLAPCIPGIARFANLDGILAIVGARIDIHARRSGVKENDRHYYLVDPSIEPQQATGVRIVEMDSRAAIIWSRATLWPLPNLGDMPAVDFEDKELKPEGKRKIPRLPSNGTAGLAYSVPGVPAKLRIRHREAGKGNWIESPWRSVDEETDYSALFPLTNLQPNSKYEFQVQASTLEGTTASSTQSGTFTTLPSTTEPIAISSDKPFRIAVSTCQEFDDRDGEYGMDLYRTLLKRQAKLFILAGDVVYYDKLARSVPLADFHWQRMYGMPSLVNFHRSVPTYFLKDDHDSYVNDSWPGQSLQWTGDFSFSKGQKIFVRQTGLPDPAFRSVKIGTDIEFWLMEGRDYRDPNTAPDGPEKSIWGDKQMAWLKESLANSQAKFKVIVSPTPIVGPDRDNKHDNHSNDAFASEGAKVREMLATHPRLIVLCGDRHWQYHSQDPKTRLQEFSVGPVSNRHAGGWKADDFRPDIHKFLRVGGGYLELELQGDAKSRVLSVTHRDPYGVTQHSVDIR